MYVWCVLFFCQKIAGTGQQRNGNVAGQKIAAGLKSTTTLIGLKSTRENQQSDP
jgi:hypothetical protein